MKKVVWVSLFIILICSINATDILAKQGDKYNLHGKRFFIQSAKTAWGVNFDAYWDVPGDGNVHKKRGNQVQVWTLHNKNARDRFYTFYHVKNDIYKIRAGYQGHYLTYTKPERKGRKIELGYPVEFKVRYLGNYQWKFLSDDGRYVVCLEGRNTKEGTDLHLWENHNVAATKWVLREKRTRNMYKPDKNGSTKDDGGSNGNDKTTNFSLKRALKHSKYTTDYFKNVSYTRMRKEMNQPDINFVRELNKKSKKSQWAFMRAILRGVSSNKTDRNENIKRNIYRKLVRVNLKKPGGFTDKMYYLTTKNLVEKLKDSENNFATRVYLKRLLKNF